MFVLEKVIDSSVANICISNSCNFIRKQNNFVVTYTSQVNSNWLPHIRKHTHTYTHPHTHIYIFVFFFIIQRVKARAIPCLHQPPTSGDNTVSVAQGGTATPGATKQLLPPDRVLRELYICIYIYARSIKSRDYIGR